MVNSKESNQELVTLQKEMESVKKLEGKLDVQIAITKSMAPKPKIRTDF